jgi:hypothetical protein
MEQSEFIRQVSDSTMHLSWFLGAGASQSAGLPTAWDIIWDLKRRYYCSEENQSVRAHDMQNPAVKEKIQSFMQSRGFPEEGDPSEYTTYFELIFGTDMDRQQKYIRAMLSPANEALSIGHRALGAMLCSGAARAIFTTNFDTVIERAVAEVGNRDLSAFHLEGSYAANAALNSEKYPIYCKLHGDFRYQSLKNLEADLQSQNAELASCFVNAGSRFGTIVAGYSGRDESIMQLFRKVLEGQNPFPHGLYWMKLRNFSPLPVASALIDEARARGVKADFVEIETFDAALSRLWKQIPNQDPALEAKVRKATKREVNIPLPQAGKGEPILRANALAVASMPTGCLQLQFNADKEWKDLRDAEGVSGDTIVCTKGQHIWAWGQRADLQRAFGADLKTITEADLSGELGNLDANLFLKGFAEKAICLSLKRDKPLLYRTWRGGSALIVNRNVADQTSLTALKAAAGGLHGIVPGLFSKVTDERPKSEQVYWAEALQIDLEQRDGRYWLLLRPDIWIWPKQSREDATDFLDRRRANRYNKKADEILSAWINLLLPSEAKAGEHTLQAFEGGDAAENPSFAINKRSAFTRRAG